MLVWISFLILVGILLSIDLTILSKLRHGVPSVKESFRQTLVWITLGLLFSGVIYYIYEHHTLNFGGTLSGKTAALQYLTGYLIEQALSVDNLFVIALIMSYFKVPPQYQHKILFWGIVGVLVTRGLMIGVGYALVSTFHWINYVFGAILIYSAYKMATTDSDAEVDFDKNWATRAIKKIYPLSNSFGNGKFFTKVNGKTAATTLFVALVVVESTDILFAFDSVPAVFSVTQDPFLVFSSNIFAILGLRSLYFVLAASMEKFEYLETALVIILGFIGVKMMLESVIHIPVGVSLAVVASLLVGGILASIYARKKVEKAGDTLKGEKKEEKVQILS
ncbi:MAG: TerC family protein [Saprospiraceae bacterium]|nr:TerC family protein [Saprospiraceae bacterium]